VVSRRLGGYICSFFAGLFVRWRFFLVGEGEVEDEWFEEEGTDIRWVGWGDDALLPHTFLDERR